MNQSNSSSDKRPSQRGSPAPAGKRPVKEVAPRRVPVAWEALEDAFENNAPEVHSYLQLEAGEVIRIVDGVADPAMHARVAADDSYLRIDPVSSREQYRWMERFIETVDDSELRERLSHAIDGKGAFRRFKDVLMSFPVERERWFAFRSERLRSCMEAWLETHGIEAVERPQWRVPSAEEVVAQVEQVPEVSTRKKSRAQASEAQRGRLHELVDSLPVRELDTASAFLEFLRERRPTPRTRAKDAGATGKASGGGASTDAGASGDGAGAGETAPGAPSDPAPSGGGRARGSARAGARGLARSVEAAPADGERAAVARDASSDKGA